MSVAMSSLESPRSSVFTFESSVHSCHVLRCLDDQRRRDLLCDITVVAEGRSFRAHRSVLASCSDYFTHRVSSHAPQGHVITLPQEVVVSGFEPLLQFAYTSKLLFSKDNVMEIRHCASVLGFRDLDSACFDFLLPKFFNSSTASFQRKTCCKTRCRTQSPMAELSNIDTNKDVLDDDKGVKVVSDSPVEQDVGGQPANFKTGSSKNTSHSPEADIQSDNQTDYSLQFPKYRKFQQACGKVRPCLEDCVPETNPNSSVVTEEVIPLPLPQSCLPCSSGGGFREGPAVETSVENASLLSQTQTDQAGQGEEEEEKTGEEEYEEERETNEGKRKWDETSREADGENIERYERIGEEEERRRGERASGVDWLSSILPLMEVSSGRPVRCEESPGLGDGTAGTAPHRCPLEVPGLSKQSPGGVGARGHHEGIDPAISSQPQTEPEQGGKVERGIEHGGSESREGERRVRGWEERSSVEREMAEHLSELSFPPLLQDFLPGTEPGNLRSSSPTLDWLNQLDISSSTGDCPFLHGLDRGTGKGTDRGTKRGTGLGCEGPSQLEKSPCVSSLTSGDDGDSDCFDTEGDSEFCSYSQRVKKVQLPFSLGRIVRLSRNDFQLMLRHQTLTREQLDFVHDVRRRSKNRIAAQRCRKRKLDCIHNLECEIDKLRTEKDQLIAERTHLNQMKLKTRHSVSALCQRVCSEAALRPEQLQVLAKYTSPDCPLSALISPTDPPSPGLGGPQASP